MKKNTMILSACLLVVAVFVFGCTGPKSMEKDMSLAESATEAMTKEEMAKEEMAKEEMATEAMMKDSAYDFSLMNLQGETVKLSEMGGKPVYIKFWASWCSICLAGLEELDALSAADNDFEVITIVSPDYNGEQSEEAFKQWFSELGYNNIEVLMDVDGEISKKYGVRAYPTSAFVDANGEIIAIQPGHLDKMSIGDMFK